MGAAPGTSFVPDETAPRRDDAIGGAEVMYRSDIVAPGTARQEQISLGERAVGFVRERFDVVPLYARVDVIAGEDTAAERLAAAIMGLAAGPARRVGGRTGR